MTEDEKKAAARKTEKAAKFKEIAIRRVNKAQDAIAALGSLSSRNNYEYTAEQAEKIGAALQSEVDKLGQRFAAALAGTPTVASGGFSLD